MNKAILIALVTGFSSCIYFTDEKEKPGLTQADSSSYQAKDSLAARDSVAVIDSINTRDTAHIDTAIKKFFTGKQYCHNPSMS